MLVKPKLLLLVFLLVIPSFTFAQDLMTSVVPSTQQTQQEQMRNIINNIGALYYEKRKENFNSAFNQIQLFQSAPNKDLYLARLYILLSGDSKENVTKAINLVRQYLRNNPNSYEGYYVLALAFNAQVSLDSFFQEPSAWKNKKDIKLREKALVNIEKSLAINNSFSEAYKLKGELSEGDEKINLFEKAIELDNLDVDAWRDLTDELNNEKRYDEAEKKLELWSQSTKSNEVSIEITIKEAQIYKYKKEYDNAILYLNKALEMRNGSGQDGVGYIYSGIDGIYEDFARAYLEMKDNYNAELYFKKYLDINPKAYYVRFDLAKLYQDTKENDKAIVQYEQVLAYDKDNTSSIYNLGLLYENTDADKAKELFNQYIELEVNKTDEDSKKWVENAKSQLNSLGVYDYPKSKKELFNEKLNWLKIPLFIGIIIFIFVLLIRFSWKYRNIMRWAILFMMVVGVVFVCLSEASNTSPDMVKALLYFISILSVGGFLLYIFRDK